MKLSILTCTIPERAQMLKRLASVLNPQISNKPVEWLVDPRPKNLPTGTKRNDLIRDSKGQYFCFVDDDDLVTTNYVDLILEAINQNPDVVTFEGWMTTNGKFTANWIIKLGENYEERGGVYYRFPNHLCPMKRELVDGIRFKPIYQMEDYQWAQKIHISGLLKTSVHIPQRIYHYDYQSVKF